MRVGLLHPERDHVLRRELPDVAGDLFADLGLEDVVAAMAQGDKELDAVARAVLLAPLTDPAVIAHRQQTVADALREPALVRDLYRLVVATLAAERKLYWGLSPTSPEATLHRAVRVLELLAGALRELRAAGDASARNCSSPGFTGFFARLAEELDDAELEAIDAHLRELGRHDDVPFSARLGPGGATTRMVLRRRAQERWWERLPLPDRHASTLRIPDRDEAGARQLAELRDRGLTRVATSLAESCEHVLGWFERLRDELGVLVGAIGLVERLDAAGTPWCMPQALTGGGAGFTTTGLTDTGLALRDGAPPVGSDVDARGPLVVVTGANQGGKSTFLRAAGLAQILLQAGLPVTATAFAADLRDGVHTHFRRGEDATLERGKLDEELERMDALAGRVTRTSLVLLNESFASTNEREAAEIGEQVVRALAEAGVRVVLVTHVHELARRLAPDAVCLRARPEPDGSRTLRITPGAPEPTSHGADLARRVLGELPAPQVV